MSTTAPKEPIRCRSSHRPYPCPRRPAAGFTMMSGLFILVVLALLGAALAFVSVMQQRSSAIDVDSARALQAARAGLEWAAFRVLRMPLRPPPPTPDTPPACPAASFSPGGRLSGFTVTITCPGFGAALQNVPNGNGTSTFYPLQANACNQPTAGGTCPNANANASTYIERQLSVTVSR